MNSLSSGDRELISQLKSKVAEERKVTTEVLTLLRDIDERRLPLSLGYSSLFDFCTRELGYSEAAAGRRIRAMRLMREIPEIEEKISSGALSLSNVSHAQRFFRDSASLTTGEKREILETLEHKSSREALRELAKLNPLLALPPEVERPISEDRYEVRFNMTERLKTKLDRLRSLLSHQDAGSSTENLIEYLADLALKKLDVSENAQTADPTEETTQRAAPAAAQSTPPPQSHSESNRYIPREIRRQVWIRDRGRCQYVGPNEKICGSTFRVQIDHRVPFSMGGAHTLENLRLLCASHNQLKAIQKLGHRVMEPFIRTQ